MRKAPATEVLTMDSLTAAMDTFNRDNRERKAKLWNLSTMKRFVPVGSEPIATRYDPAMGVLHIACSDGNVYTVPWQEAEAAERDAARECPGPIILDPNTLKPAKLEPPMMPFDDAAFEEQVQAQKQNQPPQEGPPDEWDVARGRCAELEIQLGMELLCACAHGRVQRCHGMRDPDEPSHHTACDRRADVRMIKCKGDWREERGSYPVACEACAQALLCDRRAKLDCDPDATE